MSSSEYVSAEVKKIFENPEYPSPLNSAFAAVWVISHFKGLSIKVFDVKESSSLGDYYILASVENIIQAKSLAETLERQFKKLGLKSIHTEGLESAEWILIDANDIIIHLFQENVREIFALDVLWSSHPKVDIPSELYINAEPQSETKVDNRGYF